jgi:hypothetical protein
MTKRMELNRTTARGRNGWFEGREAMVHELSQGEAKILLDVYSSRPAYPGPVHLEMAPLDAYAVGMALVEQAARHLEIQERKPVDRRSAFEWQCPFCGHEAYGSACEGCGASLVVDAIEAAHGPEGR